MTTINEIADRLSGLLLRSAEGVPATLGRYDSGGTRTVPASVQGEVFACLYDDPTLLITALNATVTPQPRLPVRVRVNTSGRYEVLGVDTLLARTFAGDALGAMNTPPIIGSAAKIMLESWQLNAGRISPLTGADLQVHMEKMTYGDTLLGNVNGDMTSLVGAMTASKKAWIVVHIDPSTNTLAFTSSAEYGLALPLPDAVAHETAVTSGHIKLWAYLMRAGDTTLPVKPRSPDSAYFVDLRPWLTLPAASGTDATAFHTDVSGEIAGLTQKSTPVSADKIVIEDSEDSDSKKYAELGDLTGGLPVHDHTDASEGGTLDTAAIASGTLADARLPDSGVTAQAYAYPSTITFDAKGRATAATAGSAPASVVLVANTFLSGSASNITLSSIPGTYKHLKLLLTLRSDRSGTNIDVILLQFNSDAGSNYAYSYDPIDQAGGITGSFSDSTTSILIYGTPGATSPSGYFSQHEIMIFNYADTTQYRGLQAFSHLHRSTALVYNGLAGGLWKNTANAISSIVLAPQTGPNWVAGSSYQLIGIN